MFLLSHCPLRKSYESPVMVVLVTLLPLAVAGCAPSGTPVGQTAAKGAPVERRATSQEIAAFFKSANKTVLTFAGYSGAGYDDEAAMLRAAEHILDEFDPKTTIVNIGATAEGIGAVYRSAKSRGFLTTGIVSSQAKQYNVALSPYVDNVFYVEDPSWGGVMKGTQRLSPTSEAVVANSDIVVGIGGGDIARDELIAAKNSGKRVRFIPADMNHQKAKESARKKGLPEPTDFRGSAWTAF
jgi:hypothetical protein